MLKLRTSKKATINRSWTDLLPENWTVLIWNFPIMIPRAGEGEFHEEEQDHAVGRKAEHGFGGMDIGNIFDDMTVDTQPTFDRRRKAIIVFNKQESNFV